jgi:hypothetical protein
MRSHDLCFLQRATGLEVGGDAGRPKRMTTDPGLHAKARRAALDHAPGIGPVHRLFRQRAGLLDLVAISQSGVLPGRELIIERGDLVQPIDDLLVDHRSCIAPSPFRFLPEERCIG